MATGPRTIGSIIARARRLLPRLGAKDRDTILALVEGFEEMAVRMHRAEHPEAYRTKVIETTAPAIDYGLRTTYLTPALGSPCDCRRRL